MENEFSAYRGGAPIGTGPVDHGSAVVPPLPGDANTPSVAIPVKFRLACGENIDEVTTTLHRPLWSTTYIGSDGTDSDTFKDAGCFCYGDNEEPTHTSSLAACFEGTTSTLVDTNMDQGNQFLPSQAFLLQAISYEHFGIDTCEPGVAEDDANESAFAPDVSAGNLARLNRDLVFTLDFLDSTRNDRPIYQMPLEWLPSIYGAPTAMSTGGAAGTTTVSTGNNGHIDWFETELLKFPILMSQVTRATEEQYRWMVKLSAPRHGKIKGLTQSIGIRIILDGLFRDDNIGTIHAYPG